MNKPSSTTKYLAIAVIIAAVLLAWRLAERRNQLRQLTLSPTPAPEPVSATPAAASASSATTPDTDRVLSADELAGIADLSTRLEQGNARPNEAVLTFKDAAAYRAFLARTEAAGLRVLARSDALLSARIGYDDLFDLQRELAGHTDDYADIGANVIMQLPSPPPADERVAGQYQPLRNGLLDFLGVDDDTTLWGRGITIAILDTGVVADSTFGQGRIRSLDIGLGLAGNGLEDGHATAVAALAAGASGDARGVAPAADLLSIRVTDTNGASDVFTVAQAIVTAVDRGARVVNISLGTYQASNTLTRAIDYATQQGAVIVAAAGNDQAALLQWPAADPRVVSVGAVDALGQQMIFSNAGPQLRLTAPGYGVQTAWNDGSRVLFDGTSASAPIVAGAIAALMSQNAGMNARDAANLLQQYASEAGALGVDENYGHGVINLGWALARNDATRIDTAVASHQYDSNTGTVDFVVQNRSARGAGGLVLTIDSGGRRREVNIPWLDAGASDVVTVPIERSLLTTGQRVVFRTQLTNAPGVLDAVPTNNIRTSELLPPPTDRVAAGN